MHLRHLVIKFVWTLKFGVNIESFPQILTIIFQSQFQILRDNETINEEKNIMINIQNLKVYHYIMLDSRNSYMMRVVLFPIFFLTHNIEGIIHGRTYTAISAMCRSTYTPTIPSNTRLSLHTDLKPKVPYHHHYSWPTWPNSFKIAPLEAADPVYIF